MRGIGRRRDVAMPATSSRGGALRGLVTRPMQGLEWGQRTRGGFWSHGDAPAVSFRGVGAVCPRGHGGA